MKKTACVLLLALTVSIIHSQDDDSFSDKTKALPVGLYFEVTIPPIIKQIWNEAPSFPFSGGATYMDFGLGVSLFQDILKAQINYGFMTQSIFENIGGSSGGFRFGGNVLSLKFFAGPEINLGKIFGSNWDRISASIHLGLNSSLFDTTESGKPAWLHSGLLQLEFPKLNFIDRRYLRSFSLYTELQLWGLPYVIEDGYFNIIDYYLSKLVLGVRAYIF